jgi:hypothetical protein
MVQRESTLASPASHTASPKDVPRQECAPKGGSVYLNDIWRLARQKWDLAGRPDGDSNRFWLEAEQELLHKARVSH